MDVDPAMVAILRSKYSASLSYDDVDSAGPPVQPLEFPTPRIYQADHISIHARDHRTGKLCELKNVIVRMQENADKPAERAYLVKKKLGKCTYGSVHLCVLLKRVPLDENLDETCWESSDDLVVLKASSWQRMTDMRGRHLEDPLKEAAALQHVGNYQPNIVGCLEILEDEDYLYTIMPYCDGGVLHGRIMGKEARSSCVDEAQARVWFLQLVQGLMHLQRKGVCHRDLALENLMLDGNGNLKIIDFGLALRVPYSDNNNIDGIADVSEGGCRRLMFTQGQAGNLFYLAPEIVSRDHCFDGFAVDIWSAGIILFILIVGSAPFRWAHPSDFRFAEISSGRLKEVTRTLGIKLSDSASDLLQNMLWANPKKRLSLSEIICHPWVEGHSETMATVIEEPVATKQSPLPVCRTTMPASTPPRSPYRPYSVTRLPPSPRNQPLALAPQVQDHPRIVQQAP